MILQSTLDEEPVLLDKACIWTAKIESAADAFAGLQIPILGTAAIEKTPTSNLMDFYSHQLFYQKSGDTSWAPVGPVQFTECFHDTLAIWNTIGLDPGAYNLKLILRDNTPDTNTVDVFKTVNLLPLWMNTPEILNPGSINLHPDPASSSLHLSSEVDLPVGTPVNIYSSTGKLVMKTMLPADHWLNVNPLTPGVYLLQIPEVPVCPSRFVKL